MLKQEAAAAASKLAAYKWAHVPRQKRQEHARRMLLARWEAASQAAAKAEAERQTTLKSIEGDLTK